MTDSEQPETVGGMVGRIATGIVLLVLGSAFAAGCVVLAVRGVLNPDLSDWADVLAEFAGYAALVGLAIALTGFEIVRRGRRARNAIVPSVIETAAGLTASPAERQGDYAAPQPPKPLV